MHRTGGRQRGDEKMTYFGCLRNVNETCLYSRPEAVGLGRILGAAGEVS